MTIPRHKNVSSSISSCRTPQANSFRATCMSTQVGDCRHSSRMQKDLIKIRPINNPSRWRRCAAHLINAHVKLDACAYFTETIPKFIQNAGSIDGAIVCAKLVSKIHDLAQDNEDPKIICQVDFENAFQSTRGSSRHEIRWR